jgi:hypothetical protein
MSIFLPVGWITPPGVMIGPCCVPVHFISTTAVLPKVFVLLIVNFESGTPLPIPA